jgi:hypothetical protein
MTVRPEPRCAKIDGEARQFAVNRQDAPAQPLSRLEQFEIPSAPLQLRRQGQPAQASADNRRIQHVALRMVCDRTQARIAQTSGRAAKNQTKKS